MSEPTHWSVMGVSPRWGGQAACRSSRVKGIGSKATAR
nr:MAG TPA: hypothetical protein [Caudoviricetes sp.]